MRNTANLYKTKYKIAKSEAIKKIVEKMKAKALTTVRNGILSVIDCYNIDNIAKELEE